MSEEKKKQEVAVTKTENDNQELAADEDPANMNFLAQFVHHLLTPGSAISSTMQAAFNVVMVILFVTWGMFLATMPDSVHVWIFGFLILGLTLSTNWFLSEVIAMKQEVDLEEKEKKEKGGEIEEGEKQKEGETSVKKTEQEEKSSDNNNKKQKNPDEPKNKKQEQKEKNNNDNGDDEGMRKRRGGEKESPKTKRSRGSKEN